jgi:hypothetical protein
VHHQYKHFGCCCSALQRLSLPSWLRGCRVSSVLYWLVQDEYERRVRTLPGGREHLRVAVIDCRRLHSSAMTLREHVGWLLKLVTQRHAVSSVLASIRDDGGPCTACIVGKYKTSIGSSSEECAHFLPHSTTLSASSTSVTDCFCNVGFGMLICNC